MLADPQTVTYATVGKSLPAISRGDSQSVYFLNDAGVQYTLTISHSFAKRNRVVCRLQRSSYSADPVVPAQNLLASMTCTFTLDFPSVGLTPSDVSSLAQAVVDLLTDSFLGKVIAGET